MSLMTRRILCFEIFLFFGIWLLLMAGGRSRMFCDPGPFWHLVLGQHIISSGQIVQEDFFSFTRSGTPWVCQSWLYEVVMALLYRLGGWDALLLWTVTLLAGLFAWIASRLRRAGLARLPTTLITVLLVAGAAPQYHVRPLVVSLPMLAGTFALLVDVEAGRRGIKRRLSLVGTARSPACRTRQSCRDSMVLPVESSYGAPCCLFYRNHLTALRGEAVENDFASAYTYQVEALRWGSAIKHERAFRIGRHQLDGLDHEVDIFWCRRSE